MGNLNEIWKPLVCYDLGGKYAISNIGRVKTVMCRNRFGWYAPKKERILFQFKNKEGYMQVGLYTMIGRLKSFKVHRLVAETFIENKHNKPQVNHLNSVRDDNRVENLEWCTNSENQIHSVRFGNYPAKYGGNAPAAKLKEADVKYIYSSPKEIYQLASQFKVHPDTVINIRRGKTWSSVTGVLLKSKTVQDRSGQNHYLTRLTNKDVVDIYTSKLPVKELSKLFTVGKTTIYAIKRGQNWSHITKGISNG